MRGLVPLVVLATFALPGAAAIGEEVYATADAARTLALGTLERSLGAVVVSEEQPRQEEAAREQDAAQRAPPPAPAPARHPGPSQAPPREERPSAAPLLAPVTRLVPLPITDVGAAPRLDLDALTRSVQDLSPLAPAERAPAVVASGAPAPAPAPTAAPPVPLEGVPVDASLVALGVAATASVAAPAASVLWERFRRVAWLAILYSRIAKERLLDHGSRERLLDAIRAKPGLAVADLVTASRIPRNTVTYHLRVLEREGLVSSTRNGRNRLFFAPGALPQRASADAFATLRHETALRLARAIGATPGVDQKALCSSLGLSPSLAHWHADRLVTTGLVEKRREGRSVRYYPGPAYGVVDARSA